VDVPKATNPLEALAGVHLKELVLEALVGHDHAVVHPHACARGYGLSVFMAKWS
jgi:hypothetical protein